MFDQSPTIYTLKRLMDTVHGPMQMINKEGKAVPCRPIGFHSIQRRLTAAWLVFSGKADAFVWPEGQ